MKATRRHIGLWISILLLLGAWSCRPSLRQQTDSRADESGYDAWKRRCDTLKQDPNILRHYTFETTSIENPTAPSVAGEPEALSYAPRGPLQIVEGRWPGKRAVRLDKGCFEGKPFEVKARSFTVECWFRKHGQGSELGNGHTNGMIFAQGDGYWCGLRVWTSYPARNLQFEIGRPKPDHAFGLSVDDAMPDGVWHHLAAAWDGKEMRLYLNGLLLCSAEYSGEYAAPTAPFRIGFANAGVGSVKMDVDEVVVHRIALSSADVLKSACFEAPLPGAVQQRFDRATEAAARKDWAVAGAEFKKVLDISGVDPEYRALARLGLGRTLGKRNQVTAAIREYTRAFDDKSTPERLRQFVLRLCAYSERGVANPTASRALYERLLDLPDLNEAERIGVRANLAERRLQEKDFAGARRQYAALTEMPGLADADRWNIRLQGAHTWLAAGDCATARAEYQKLAAEANAPPEIAICTLLCAAQSFVREKNCAEAIDVFANIRDLQNAPKHLRWEAEDRITEMKRLQQGLPARDPAATRVKLPPFPEPALAFHVAPNGADTNAGTKDRPFASLERARDAIRERKKQGGLPTGGATVFVRGATYTVSKTLELGEQDSGTEQAPIVYRAVAGEKPVFIGGVRIKGFVPVTDEAVLARLPEEARGKVLQTDLRAQGITDWGKIEPRGYGLAGYPCNPWVDLYVDGKPMPLARWPNTGFVKIGKVHQGIYHGPDSDKPGVFEYEDDRPSRWGKAKDVWMFGYWSFLWAGRRVRVASIDTDRRLITTVHRSTSGFRTGEPYYYFNLLEELDQPGEWYLDRDAGALYLYPPSDIGKAVVEFPMFAAPFLKMENVSYVTIRGLTFDLGRAEGAVMSNGRRNLLAGCAFRRLGANGVIINGGTGHGVLGCDIHHVGAGGMRVNGGDRKTLTPGGHFIENNHVYDFSRVDRAYAPAVLMEGVGNRIAHNLFNDSPHHAMRLEGYEHVIEFNEIHSVVYESDDQGGIDMWGNPTYRGHIQRYNFWHHIGSGRDVAGQAGIRLDDMISDVLIYGNVFYRCSGGHFGGIQIHGGKDNIADNNLFIDCKYAISFSPWGQKRWEEVLADAGLVARIGRDGVDITKPPYSTRYPDLARMKENADRNFLWRNLAVDCGHFAVRERGVNELMDNHMFTGDPGFADASRRNFALRNDSAVYNRFGFRPIPFDEIGLYNDEYRATWPVKHDITPHYVREY